MISWYYIKKYIITVYFGLLNSRTGTKLNAKTSCKGFLRKSKSQTCDLVIQTPVASFSYKICAKYPRYKYQTTPSTSYKLRQVGYKNCVQSWALSPFILKSTKLIPEHTLVYRQTWSFRFVDWLTSATPSPNLILPTRLLQVLILTAPVLINTYRTLNTLVNLAQTITKSTRGLITTKRPLLPTNNSINLITSNHNVVKLLHDTSPNLQYSSFGDTDCLNLNSFKSDNRFAPSRGHQNLNRAEADADCAENQKKSPNTVFLVRVLAVIRSILTARKTFVVSKLRTSDSSSGRACYELSSEELIFIKMLLKACKIKVKSLTQTNDSNRVTVVFYKGRVKNDNFSPRAHIPMSQLKKSLKFRKLTKSLVIFFRKTTNIFANLDLLDTSTGLTAKSRQKKKLKFILKKKKLVPMSYRAVYDLYKKISKLKAVPSVSKSFINEARKLNTQIYGSEGGKIHDYNSMNIETFWKVLSITTKLYTGESSNSQNPSLGNFTYDAALNQVPNFTNNFTNFSFKKIVFSYSSNYNPYAASGSNIADCSSLRSTAALELFNSHKLNLPRQEHFLKLINSLTKLRIIKGGLRQIYKFKPIQGTYSSNFMLSIAKKYLEYFFNSPVSLFFNFEFYNYLTSAEVVFLSSVVSRLKLFAFKFSTIFFLSEFVDVVYLSLRKKNLKLVLTYVQRILKKLVLWDHKKFLLFFFSLFSEQFFQKTELLHIVGIKMTIKGKIAVGGNSRKRSMILNLGFTNSSMRYKGLHTLNTLFSTSTGALGFKVWLFFSS